MKSVFLMGMLAMVLTAQAKAEEKSCQKNSDCEVVRVYTKCDVDKQKLRNKIAELEKRVKELEARKQRVVTVEVYKERVVRVEKEKEVIKHNLLGLYMAKDAYGGSTSQQNGSASANVTTAYLPGIKYQYEFGFGLVPEVGINVKGDPLVGLGFEF
jgi:hypothetical protein